MSLSLLLVSLFTIVEFNCENLFDTRHDSLKLDQEFLPTSDYHWTPTRYWRKLSRVGQALVATGEVSGTMLLPDLAVLTEVENDSVMRDLCCRSLLRTAGYRWVMTDSPDERGIDVALLYSPLSFRLLSYSFVRVTPPLGFQPTRDILYANPAWWPRAIRYMWWECMLPAEETGSWPRGLIEWLLPGRCASWSIP